MNLYQIKTKSGEILSEGATMAEVKKITSATSQQVSDAACRGIAANRQYYIEIVDKKLHPQVDAKLLKEYDQARVHLLRLCGMNPEEET